MSLLLPHPLQPRILLFPSPRLPIVPFLVGTSRHRLTRHPPGDPSCSRFDDDCRSATAGDRLRCSHHRGPRRDPQRASRHHNSSRTPSSYPSPSPSRRTSNGYLRAQVRPHKFVPLRSSSTTMQKAPTAARDDTADHPLTVPTLLFPLAQLLDATGSTESNTSETTSWSGCSSI